MFEKEKEKPKTNDTIYDDWKKYIELRKKIKPISSEQQ